MFFFFLGTMGVCFVCDSKLFGERTRVCTSITPHSNVPYPEKIAELMGEEFVIIVTPSDQVCKHCTTLFTHMDKLEHDLRIVKNSMVAHIQKKYGILPPNEPIKTIDVNIFILFIMTNNHLSLLLYFIYYVPF